VEERAMTNLEYVADGFWIGGEWVVRPERELTSFVAPSTEDIYGKAARPTTDDADHAVTAARESFRAGTWSTMPVAERAAVILRACERVLDRVPAIARTAAFEIGAPVEITTMMTGLVVNVIRGMCAVAESVPDIEAGIGQWEYELQREPAGVVLDIVPWNSPFTGTMMKSAQALLAGCSVISKPPPTAPFAVVEWGRALRDAGLPSGVYSILPSEVDVSEHLVTHPDVSLVVFTGGTEIGRRVAELCGRNLKRVVLELGGKSAAVVLEDADLQLAVDAVASGVYFNSGQICSALSRLVAPRAAVDEIVEMLRLKAKGIAIGSPFDSTTTMGPMASGSHYRRVLGCIEAGRAEGATLVYGGGRPPALPRGWYIEPALFIADNSMTIARDEIFGPVISIIPHDGEDDAVRIANDSAFGLGGSVFSADFERARSVASRLDTGSVTVNGYTTNLLAPRDPHKTSGHGSVTGVAGFQNFRSSRVVNLRMGTGSWQPTQLFAETGQD
jgi:aldehyde dehydrogenase (NAD+)